MVKTLKDIDICDKKVIIRCDFNVPIEKGKILDDTRITESLDTINYCLDNNCKIILMSHLGRIKDKKDLKDNSLKPVATRLSKLLNKKVIFVPETRGKNLEEKVKNLKNGQILLIENTRYEDLKGKKESSCNTRLAKYWSKFGDIFINDAFGTLHRAHASNVGISKILPSCVGFLVEKELNRLNELKCPDKPFIVILGGAKISDKVGAIKTLVNSADYILIGGGMANTFLKAEGFNVGMSLVDEDSISFCKRILSKYSDKIILPVDVTVSKEFKDSKKYENKDITEIEEDDIIMDIGSQTITIFNNILSKSKTVFWNGPLGVYNFKNYIIGTKEVMTALTKSKTKTILGGGDIVAASEILNLKNKVYHASTGGGATLEYLEGKKLEGLKKIK